MKKSSDRHHFELIPKEDLTPIVKKLANKKAKIQLWVKGREKDSENFIAESYKGDSQKLLIKRSGTILQTLQVSSLRGKSVLFLATIGDIHYCTTTYLQYDEGDSAHFVVLQDMVFKGQKRQNYRIRSSRSLYLALKINNETYSAKDISAGGLSFVLKKKEDLAPFKKGTEFEKVGLKINEAFFEIPTMQVVNTSEEKDRRTKTVKGHRVGLRFVKLPKEIEETLFRLINAEARALEMAKKFA